jgi:hypothetical protein
MGLPTLSVCLLVCVCVCVCPPYHPPRCLECVRAWLIGTRGVASRVWCIGPMGSALFTCFTSYLRLPPPTSAVGAAPPAHPSTRTQTDRHIQTHIQTPTPRRTCMRVHVWTDTHTAHPRTDSGAAAAATGQLPLPARDVRGGRHRRRQDAHGPQGGPSLSTAQKDCVCVCVCVCTRYAQLSDGLSV